MSNLVIPNTIKMIITDFDGIVTDNCVYVNSDGSMQRKLNFKDIMAFSILKKNGYEVAIISGESNSAIKLLAEKFDIKEIHQGIRNKIEVLKTIVEKYNLNENEYLYIGDDVNDIACLEYVQCKFTVPNAVKKVKGIPNIQITESQGGDGAFREIVDCLLDSKI